MSKKDNKSSPKKKSFHSKPNDKKNNTKPTQIETVTVNTDQNDKLHEQILALGGTKGDLKFLENVDLDDMDDELMTTNEDKELTKSLQQELQGFIKNIGLTTQLAEKYEEEEEDDDDGEDENDDDDEEEEEEDENEDENEDESEDEDGDKDEDDDDEEDNNSDEKEEANETTPPNRKSTKETTQNRKGSNLFVDPTPYWYQAELSTIPSTKDQKLTSTALNEKIDYARQLLDTENENASKSSLLSSSDRTFMSNIMQSGTLQDKVSALTLLVQESPLHALKTMDTMMSMTKKKGRKEANLAIISLKDLFIGSVLPDRKLVYFADRPLKHNEVTDRHLLLWYFEDFLKKYYFEFIQQIEALSHDPLVYVRYSMVNCLQGLLAGKPEQEQNLLKLLVNKLGDSENKVAAKASQLLIELMVQHPGMKIFVVREIEQLILRPNVSERAQYYAIITLNQTILTSKEGSVANKLIDIYFMFFQRLLKITEDDESKEKEKEKDDEKENEKDPKKKKNRKQLEREKKDAQKQAELDDYKSKMIAAILTGVNRAFHFATIPDEKVEKHMQVLFRITHTGTFNTAIQALSLIFSVSLAKNTQSDRFYRTLYESMFDPRIMTSSKQAMYLNLLFKAIRADEDQRRVKAFVKRIVQIAGYHQPAFICGLFYILSQLMEKQPALRSMITTPEDNDDEEHFEDATDDDDEEEGENKTKEKSTTQPTQQENLSTYDGRKRDPQFSNADKTCLWELIPFKDHYHPSVVKYAECLFNGEPITENPDLHHFTLMNFLDRFVYRNPKKQQTTKGSSLMQPLANRRDGGVLLSRGAASLQSNNIPLNSEEFWRKKVDQVPVDEIFFHKYFNQKASNKPTATSKISKTGDEEEDEENEIWRAMMASVPGGLDDDELALEDEDDEEDDEAMRALLMESDDEEEGAEEVEGLNEDDEDSDGLEDMESFESELNHVDDIEFLNASSMDDESDIEVQKKTKRKTSGTSDQPSKKKKKTQELPTFASYEDYATLLDKEEDGF